MTQGTQHLVVGDTDAAEASFRGASEELAVITGLLWTAGWLTDDQVHVAAQTSLLSPFSSLDSVQHAAITDVLKDQQSHRLAANVNVAEACFWNLSGQALADTLDVPARTTLEFSQNAPYAPGLVLEVGMRIEQRPSDSATVPDGLSVNDVTVKRFVLESGSGLARGAIVLDGASPPALCRDSATEWRGPLPAAYSGPMRTRGLPQPHSPGPRGPVVRLAACLALAGASCGGSAAPSEAEPAEAGVGRPNVLLVVVDTLRRDHLSAYGYRRETSPALQALAEQGVRYDNAISQAPWTTPSIASLLTSRYPAALGIEGERSALSDDEVLLAESLLAAGYDTAAVISHSFLGSTWNFDQGFRVFDEANVQGHAAVTSSGVTDAAVRELRRMGAGGAPFFLFVHYFDPHAAYVEHDAYPFRGEEDYEGRIRSGMLFRDLRAIEAEVDARDAEELKRLYDSEIAFTDHHLSRLFDALKVQGAFEDSLIIVTADHGEEFLERGRLGHAKSLFQELVNVPLIVKPPRAFPRAEALRGSVVADALPLLDVVPTILDVTGTAHAGRVEGLSLFEARPKGRTFFTETARANGWAAAVQGRYKLLFLGPQRMSLFDLAADPSEAVDVSGERPEMTGAMGAAVVEWRHDQRAQASAGSAVELNAAERARIENLGYGGDGE